MEHSSPKEFFKQHLILMSSVIRQKSATENHKCRVQLDKRVERVKDF